MPGLQILSRDSTITADEVAAFGMPTIGPVGRQGDEEEEQEEEEYDDDDCETRDVESPPASVHAEEDGEGSCLPPDEHSALDGAVHRVNREHARAQGRVCPSSSMNDDTLGETTGTFTFPDRSITLSLRRRERKAGLEWSRST